MTIRIPVRPLLALGGLAVFLFLTALVSFIFTRAGSADSDWLTCSGQAMEKYLDGSQAVLDADSDAPNYPSSSSSDYVWEAYEKDFKKYQDDFQNQEDEYGRVTQAWIDETRTCLDQ